jgi:hypothetical protein
VTGSGRGRSAAIGALIGVILIAGAAGLYGTIGAPRGSRKAPERVVLIVESASADGSTGAQLLALVADGRLQDVSPDTSVTVPGTSGDTLRDAYTFGGPAGVAAALGASRGISGVGYLAIPQSVWGPAVDRRGGVSVEIPVEMNVFDGGSMTTLRAGKQVLSGAGIAVALRGLPYIGAADQTDLRTSLEQGIASSIAGQGIDAQAMRSDMSKTVLAGWLGSILAESVAK